MAMCKDPNKSHKLCVHGCQYRCERTGMYFEEHIIKPRVTDDNGIVIAYWSDSFQEVLRKHPRVLDIFKELSD